LIGQERVQDKIEEYRQTVTMQMTPVVNLVKVLTTQHDESFVQLYCSTLPHDYQNPAEMSRLLTVLDVKPDQRDARMLSFSMHAVPEVCLAAFPVAMDLAVALGRQNSPLCIPCVLRTCSRPFG
jgi:hypothetical protein